ncbi:MAG: molybdopterin-dependent oxidoreductase, partial [Alphaproteobacteria bacterium]|nr:molybdopterin-dependent oxidoreductase [Alphaproteobacteria bacterium]
GHLRAFGEDVVPGCYDDIGKADLVVQVGSNMAWCHPVLYQRLMAARGTKIVAIDPRRTATAETADLYLALRPGSDVSLFNGLLVHLAECGAMDHGWIARHVCGFADALDAARRDAPSIEAVAGATDLRAADVRRFYDLFARTERVVTLYSQGVNQSVCGTDKVGAILNCHLATARIGRPGMGPFSLTGQPNAMGGREVGGLANALTCHLEIENPAHRAAVQAFWASPAMPERAGLKAVDMFRAVGEGRIKAIWIIHSNPAVSLPDADAVRAALAGCEFVVVSDITARTDTACLADVLLPATAWGEKEGTVTNSERCISRQRAFLPPPGQARPDWWMLCEVARRMGWGDAFAYVSPAAIFREYAALSGIAGTLGRDFDISDLASISDEDYATLAPFVWPRSAARNGGRFFADGGFYTQDGRARMVPIQPRPPVAQRSSAFPFRLNTGRVRDHWHTMTRTGKSPRLSQHMAEPFVELHPTDAARLGIAAASLVRVNSPTGNALLRAVVTDRVRPGTLFAPMHWTGQTASAGRVDALVPAVTDPVSGQPESKAAVVSIAPFAARWFGFAVSMTEPSPPVAYWAKARAKGGWRVELADDSVPADWEDFAKALFSLPDAQAVTMIDAGRGLARVALI